MLRRGYWLSVLKVHEDKWLFYRTLLGEQLEASVEMLPKEDRELPESQTCPRSNCCGATGCTAPFLSTCRGRNTRRITLTFHFLSTHDRTVTKAVGRMQQTNRQSSEPTENIVSVDTASHLNAAHAIRMSQKTARSEARSDMTIQQPAHMPSENTTALRKYHRAFWVSQHFQKSCFPTMAYCIFCDMSQFTTPPPTPTP